ncbi:hypothetical protein BLA29_015563 [Euroglyphus maynei]|uniref:Uncharacterized protein n=1 Tax=Euroglyphus maynei TaxID=6958 RepID=A0A1Y3B1R7_EURMA|nr:hypothetical protein BLA29_015563 [Euroglyphus maynei]
MQWYRRKTRFTRTCRKSWPTR